MPLRVAMMNEQTELSHGFLPTVAELMLTGRTLPLLTRAVVVGEALRRAALAMHRVPSATLAGKMHLGRLLLGSIDGCCRRSQTNPRPLPNHQMFLSPRSVR